MNNKVWKRVFITIGSVVVAAVGLVIFFIIAICSIAEASRKAENEKTRKNCK